MLIFAGCKQNEAEVPNVTELPPVVDSAPAPEPEQEQEPEPEQDELEEKSYNITPPENDMVFDFAEFPEKDFPRGQWTLNQLINKYGTPDEVYAHYQPVFSAGYVYMTFIHNNIRVYSCAESADQFSFKEEVFSQSDSELYKEKKYFNLNENDKNFKFEVMSIELFTNAIKYPNNIEIGISTKQDVLDAYPSGTAYLYESWGEDYYFNRIIYDYNFRSENGELLDWSFGRVEYNFDKSEILNSITVCWFSGD
jgi:hypothetical protein